jgi:hypothetical protein
MFLQPEIRPPARLFTRNAKIGKTRKQRFFERFCGLSDGEEARQT